MLIVGSRTSSALISVEGRSYPIVVPVATATAGLPSFGDLMAWLLLSKVGSGFDSDNPFCMMMFFYLPAVVDTLEILTLFPLVLKEEPFIRLIAMLVLKFTPLYISAKTYDLI